MKGTEKTLQGLIFGIQPFSIHDGNGIRTNVFLKGCPLRCLWCHNPEGLSPKPDIQYFENKCVHCGKCGHVYKNMEKTSKASQEEKERYVHKCWYGALEMAGEYMTVEDVLEEVMKDQKFYETSKGGITVSGGEPMLQADFVYELLKEAKVRGLATAMETSGYAKREKYEKVMPYVDEFLWDYKATGDKMHEELTGVDQKMILDNLKYLYDQGAVITLRCPVIPGANDTEEHFQGIARILYELERLKGWEIMPYHRLGIPKEKRLGKERHHEFEVPKKELVEQWKQKIETYKKDM